MRAIAGRWAGATLWICLQVNATAVAKASTSATAPSSEAAVEACPCDAAVLAYLLGWSGAGRTALADDELSTHCVTLTCMASKLRRAGFRVRETRLSPRELMRSSVPVVVLLHLPGGHVHFEVYLGFTGATGSFADPTLASGKARHRDLRRLADIWDGEALVVERGPPDRWWPAVATGSIVATAGAAWTAMWLIARRRTNSGRESCKG